MQQTIADNLFLLLQTEAEPNSPDTRELSYRRALAAVGRSQQRTEAAPLRLPSPLERSRCRTQPLLLALTLIQCLAN